MGLDKKRQRLITDWIEQYLIFHHEVVRIKHNRAKRSVHNKAQLGLLFMLSHHQPTTIGELADLTHTTSGAASQLIDNLVKQGLVKREMDEKDRRIARISLSAAGQRQCQLQRDAKIAEVCWLFDDMTDAELSNLVAVQKKLADKIKQYRRGK